MGRRLLPLLLLCGCDVVFGLERPDPPPPPPPVPGEWSAVVSGSLHSCAIQTDRSLWCWGENIYGEIGTGAGAPIEVTKPVQVGTDTWTTVAVGSIHTCAIREDATLWCWGNNAQGALGDNTHENRAEPVMIGAEHWRAVAAADAYTCAIRDDRSLWCWGANTVGQLGDGTSAERPAPSLIDGTHDWSDVTAGTQHACALTTDGALWCWGTGPLGGPRQTSNVPVQVEATRSWSSIAAGSFVTCGISDGTVLCWGTNASAALGNGTLASHTDAQSISSNRTDWRAVTMHYSTVCALAEDGALACWGDNRRGQIGSDLAQELQTTPHAIAVPSATWKASAPGTLHACAIDGDSHLWCTGDNGVGQRGDGTGGSRIDPVEIDSAQWTVIAAGETSACGLRGGQLWCWGENGVGQLGDGTINARQVPSQTMMQQPTAKLAVGANHTCDVDAGGRLWCWGSNQAAQLGNVMAASVPTPMMQQLVAIVGPIGIYEQTCAVGADMYGYCWGRNTTGQLGRGMVTAMEPTASRVVNAALAPIVFSSMSAGIGHTCGLSASAIACWGRNTEGQVGNGTLQTTAVGQQTGVVASQLDVGGYHSCAVYGATGKLSCWGSNTYGQIGDGTAVFSRPTPTGVPGVWTEVSAGAAHTCALKMGGELWCWGDNSRGTLGDGTRTNRTAPVRVPGSWTAVSAGSQFTCGVQTGGSLWCWGANLWGQLGDNTAWNTRFVQIGMP